MNNILDLLTTEEKKIVKVVDLLDGEILFHEDDICECVGIIISGEIKISSYSFEGQEIIYNELNPGMIFGNNLLFSSDPRYKGSVISKNTAKVGLIYKKDLINLFKNNVDFLLQYLNYQSDVGKQLNSKIKLLSLNKAEERFLYFLYINNNQIRYKSISSLADSLSLQRETVSRLISKLETEGKIIKKNKTIILVK